MKKGLFIVLGSVTFGLGTLGIFLPFLPTAVFYLLTGFFWIRSSDKLHQRLVQSTSYQKYVQHALVNKNITTKGMIRMFLVLLIIFLIPGILVDNLLMRSTLTVVYIVHVVGLTWYLTGKNKRVENEIELED